MPTRKHIKKKIKRIFSVPLLRAAVVVTPWIYHGYMKLVWLTSRKRVVGVAEGIELGEPRGGAVFAVYHETVFLTLFAGRKEKLQTLASRSDSGEVIAAVIEHFGCTCARGGSSKKASRRTPIVKQMIEHMKANPGTVTAITVDGSSGPRRKLKPGVIEVARATQTPLFAVHAHATLRLRLPTWDKTIVPLLFGRINIMTLGPIDVPEHLAPAQMDDLKQRVQDLLDVAVEQAESGRMNPRAGDECLIAMQKLGD